MSRFLDRFPSPVVIAEIGAKYAEMAVLKDMVTAARDAGADVVKFQTYRAETISTPGATFTFEDGSVVPQYEFFKAYELSPADHEELDAHCRDTGIAWFSTPSHTDDVDLLERFDPIAYKTGSDDLTNLRFLRQIAETGRPMVVSTGMSTMDEVSHAVEAITGTGNDDLTLLHCVVSYPSRPEDANLRAIETLHQAFGLPVGLSDHTTDELTSVLATQLGAVAIEKHFTLDHALRLPDHQASLDPGQFKRLVDCVRLVRKALGDGEKRVVETEDEWRRSSRKSLFSQRTIAKGEAIADDAIAVRRPGEGISPLELDRVVGKKAKRDIPADTLISWDMV